jgi:AcrR family transcriptional regulator
MERPMLSRGVVDGFRRERLLDAVAQAAMERGGNNVTVAHVVAIAGTSRSGFYEYFEDRHDAIVSGVEVGLTALERRIGEGCEVRAGDDFATRTRTAITAAVEWVDANLASAYLGLVEAPASGSRAIELQLAFIDRLAGRLAAAAPPVSPAPRLLPRLLVGGAVSTIAQRIRSGRAEELSGSIAPLTQMMLTAYHVSGDERVD